MITVRVTGWRPGMRKISLTKLIQESAGTELGLAKDMVDGLLDGRPFALRFEDEDRARFFADRAEELGAEVIAE